jgi:hypothetical protein
MGHGAWGMGHRAWGMGHGAWGMGKQAVCVRLITRCVYTVGGEGEQDFKVPLPVGEGFRVRADKSDMHPLGFTLRSTQPT